jgi:glycine cleavage system H protein
MSNVPENLKYSREHEWAKIEGDTAVVGITDFAQHELTDVVFVDLPAKGKKVEAGKNLAVVESVKSVSDVFCPLSGEVIEVNTVLNDAPETINKDCYGKGWIAKIKISNNAELNKLLSAADYKKHISSGGH